MLLRAAQLEVQAAQSNPHGELYRCLAAVLLAAFAIESFANTIAERVLASWPEVERKPCIVKLSLLAHQLNVSFCMSEKPWSEAKSLFDLRNDLVHAKPELIQQEGVAMQAEYDRLSSELPESTLEAQLTLAAAQSAVATAEAIRDLLGLAVAPTVRFGLFADMATHSVSRE